MLIDSGVDIVNVADGPRAMARMSNLAFCSLLIERCGIQPILHVCGRDRNLLGQFSHLLGAHAIGIRNLVMITGDPPKVGDYPEATAVYDVDAIGLLQMASNANRGLDPAGKLSPGGKTSFLIATGVEPGAADLDREVRRLEKKKTAGAELVMTQPVFQPDLLADVLQRIEHLELPIMVGVLPLVSYKNAEFLHNEVPGMQIPEEIRERMRKTPGGEAARKEGIKIAREMLYAVRARVQGPISCRPWPIRACAGGSGGLKVARRTPGQAAQASQEPVTAAWPRPLSSPAELAARLDRPEIRLIECGVAYHMLPDRSDFRVDSTEPLYTTGHIPGAVFADPIAALSDRGSGLRFTMPDPASLAQAFGRLGVGDGTFVVLYCRDHNVFAARLWWMLRAIGFDDAAVLDGGFARWTQEGWHVTVEVPRHSPVHLGRARALACSWGRGQSARRSAIPASPSSTRCRRTSTRAGAA
jgi:5,10-methylenetetrahydrofolate reductase/rhodanese-related sulfurtransferase